MVCAWPEAFCNKENSIHTCTYVVSNTVLAYIACACMVTERNADSVTIVLPGVDAEILLKGGGANLGY